MKKILSLLLSVTLLFTVLAVAAVPQAVAEDTTKDVFTIDGVLDNKYIKTDSAGNTYYWHLSSDSDCYDTVGGTSPLFPGEDGNTCEADVYTAYDQDYIYVYVKVTDPIIQQWDYQHWNHGGWGDCISIWMDPDPSTQGMMPDGKTDDPLTTNWQWFFANCASSNQADSQVRLQGYDYTGTATYNGYTVSPSGFVIEDYHDYMKTWLTDTKNYCPFRFDGGYGVEARYARVSTEKNYQFNISVGNSPYKNDPAYTLSFGAAWWLSYSGCKQVVYNFDNYPFKSTDPTPDPDPDPTPTPTEDVLGDVNLDGKVTTTDALLALRHAVKKITLTGKALNLANVTKDDTEVNTTDALWILRKAVNPDLVFPRTWPEVDPNKNLSKVDGLTVPSSVLDNDAYDEDPTSDNTFKIKGDGLTQKAIYVVSTTALRPSSTDTYYNTDVSRFIMSLQGIVNRDFGVTHSSIIYMMSDTSDNTWLKYMLDTDGSLFKSNAFTKVQVRTLDSVFQLFDTQIKQCGIVLWDPAVPSTANVAATICGVDGYLPVKYDTTEGSFYNTLIAKYGEGIVKQSLVGYFSSITAADAGKTKTVDGTSYVSSGSTKCDAYLWALERYMGRCSANYIAYTPDGAGSVSTSLTSQGAGADAQGAGMNCINNHDYYIARRCFFFDLTCYQYETPCDDPNQPLGTDSAVLAKILLARAKRAAAASSPTFGQLLGFPPWWQKYTNYHSQGSLDPTYLEWMFVEFATCYNCAKEADAAQPCSMTNASAYYKYSVSLKEFTNTKPTTKETFDSNTKYYLFYVGDYDSSAWMKTHVANFWIKDTKRGSIPLMWSFNPNLSNRNPMIWEFIYANKTANDYIAAGEGAGYIIPSALFTNNSLAYTHMSRPSELGNADTLWATYSAKYYNLLDIDITGFIINGAQDVNAPIMKCFSQFSPTGVFHNSPSLPLSIYKGTPFVYMQNGVSASMASIDNSAAAMYSHMMGTMKNYNFAAYRTICNSPSELYSLQSAFNTYAAGKGQTVKFVDPYTYFDLIKQSGQGTVIQ